MRSDTSPTLPVVDVSILVQPETGPMAPYGLFEVLRAAGGAGARTNVGARFEPKIIARGADAFESSVGIPLTPHCSIAEVEKSSLIIICDAELQPGESPEGRWDPEIAWVCRQFEAGAVLCSTCSGALVLAEAGLLDGREATSHWATAALFRDRYPKIRFRPERILCDSGHAGRLITSGGASSWQDLALYLVGRFCGVVEAARIARLFVIGERSMGQLPFSTMAAPRQHEDRAIIRAQTWIAENYALPNPVAQMARQSGLHDRTFKRRFRQATGYSPIDYVHALRVEEAKHFLETTRMSIEALAAEIGYADPAHFSRLFCRLAGITPAKWRRCYGAESVPNP